MATITNQYWMKAVIGTIRVLLLILLLSLVASCSPANQASQGTGDTGYLTPIPEATVIAYDDPGPITGQLQAVLAARKLLLTTRLSFAEPPQVISADEVTFAEAVEWVKKTGEFTASDIPSDAKVWLVVFEGHSLVVPPGPSSTGTPAAASLGCTYVIFAADGQGSVTNYAGVTCPRSK